MADTYRIFVNKTFDPGRLTECWLHLMSGVYYSMTSGLTVYGYDCRVREESDMLVFESVYGVDAPTSGDTDWSVYQVVFPGIFGDKLPFPWVARSGALQVGSVMRWDASAPNPLTRDDLQLAITEMTDLYLSALQDLTDTASTAPDIAMEPTGWWTDYLYTQGFQLAGGGLRFQGVVSVQCWDAESIEWAGGGDYSALATGTLTTIAAKSDVAQVVEVLQEIALSRFEISANNGAQMFSVKGGARTD